MGDRVKTGIKLKISYSNTMLNYQFFQKFKLLRNGKFNRLAIILFVRTKETMNLFPGWKIQT